MSLNYLRNRSNRIAPDHQYRLVMREAEKANHRPGRRRKIA